MFEFAATHATVVVILLSVCLFATILYCYRRRRNKMRPGFDKNGFETRRTPDLLEQQQLEDEEAERQQHSAAVHIKPMRFRPRSSPNEDPHAARRYDPSSQQPPSGFPAGKSLPAGNADVGESGQEPGVNGRRRPFWDKSDYTPRYQRLSKAVLILPTDKKKKTFADVAGQDETVARLREVVEWQKESEIYDRHNAKMPKGILLVGPPGNGKTLCAQAVAGEIDGSIFIISGSDFVEMYVGTGASRIRDLFIDARNQRRQTLKPVVIFIDEIDAVGGARSGGGGKANSEQEQTLNQLLVEMDGFSKTEGILLLAATNRVDILDKALTRKGRFDLQINVDLPDIKGREAILRLHSQDKKLAADVSYALLARRTTGMSGADLMAAANEAAIIAARHQSKLEKSSDSKIARAARGKITPITVQMFDEAVSIVESGEARRGRFDAMSEEDKDETARHELGHALAIARTGGDPITKITILPRGRALGYVQTHTEKDRFTLSETALRKRIICALSGRLAQQMFSGTVDTGAANDFEQANNMARRMVTQFGMSKLGYMHLPDDGSVTVGPTLADKIDEEQRRIINECAADAREILEADRAFLEYMTPILVEQETIFGYDFMATLNGATRSSVARHTS